MIASPVPAPAPRQVYQDLKEYFDHIQYRIHSEQDRITLTHNILKIRTRDGVTGRIEANCIQFVDGAYIRFFEELTVKRHEPVKRERYAYEYHWSENGHDLMFRYERDPKRAKPFVHELLHLQAFREEPRFKVHETNFDEIFDFVLHNFYVGH